jgi:sugar lactone lactonase YvrE
MRFLISMCLATIDLVKVTTPNMNASLQDLPAPFIGEPRVAWAAGALLGEGLCWSPSSQSLYWVDIQGHRLMRWWPATDERRTWSFDETVSAVAERENGQGLVIALKSGFAFFDPDTGALRRLHEPERHLPGNRFNDGKCDARGRFWAGSMDIACEARTGSLWCLHPDGEGTRVRKAWDACFAVTNGPAWSPDGRTMWVNETAHNRIHRGGFDEASGELVEPAVWLRLPKGDGYPDGMTVDALGRLWIAHWAGGCVTCHAPDDGRELARLKLPVSLVTNVAFGGPRLGTLFITSACGELTAEQQAAEPLAGALFTVETDAVGLPPGRFAG